MTLQERLRKNPLKDIIIPVIAAMQGKYVTYEMKAAVAEILSVKSDNWGLKVLGTAPPRFIKIDPSPRPPKKKPPVSPTDLVNNSGVQSDIALLRTLREKLDSIDTTLPNSWIWFNEISEMYYGLVPFIDYFSTTFEDGRYVDDILYSTGLALRPGASLNGIVFTDLKDGATGSIASPTTIRFDVGQMNAGMGSDAGTYFTVYSAPTIRQVVVFRVDGVGNAPEIAAIPGVTDEIVYSNLLQADSASQTRLKIRATVNGIAGLQGDLVDGDTFGLYVRTDTDTLLPDPTAVQALPTTPPWSGATYTAGSAETKAAAIAQTELDFSPAIIEGLNSTGFSLKDTGAERVYGVWFSLDYDPGVEPVIPGVDSGYIQIGIKASDTISDIIVTLNNAIKNIVGDLTIKEDTLTIEADTALDGVFIDGFNAAKGSGGETVLKDADDNILAIGLETDEEYAESWNALKVPADLLIDVVTPYIKAMGGGHNACCTNGGEVCCREGSIQTEAIAKCCRLRKSKVDDVKGLMITSNTESTSTTLTFNAPPRTRRNSRRSNRPGPI